MPEVKLIPASSEDMPSIAQLADTIWNQHYPAIISQEQINYMLARMYSAVSLLDQITTKRHLFYFIVSEASKIGFISVHQAPEKKWFINKFYIDQRLARKGIGSATYHEFIRMHHPASLSLTVNRQNFKAINFYFKLGFKIKEVADFDIGEGYVMNDFVMEIKLP